jgi:hypothetical protein
MLPSELIIIQQYREKKFTVYSSLIQTLKQEEKSHELIVWNSNMRPLDTAPLPERKKRVISSLCGTQTSAHLALSGIDPLGTARKLPVRKKKSDSY